MRNHMLHGRKHWFVIATAIVFTLMAACQERSTSPSISPDPAANTGGGANSPGDTGSTTPPVTGATSITLAVTVGSAVAGSDTSQYAPLANAMVSVLRQTLSRNPGNGADTLTTSETVVASGTTDANGVATLQNLPSAAYRVEATSAAAGGQSGSAWISPPYAANVATTIIVRPRP